MDAAGVNAGRGRRGEAGESVGPEDRWARAAPSG